MKKLRENINNIHKSCLMKDLYPSSDMKLKKKKKQLKNMGKTFEQIASPKKVHGWQIST